jgi:hypothetical protein
MNNLEVRCTCRRSPLLAVCGRDEKENHFLQIKHMKGGHILMHIIVTSGDVRVQCRECFRWMRVKIIKTTIETSQEKLPESIPV